MSKVIISSNPSGTATFTIASPATNNNRVLTIPDADGNFVLDTAFQTLTNKTLTTPTINGGVISGTPVQGGVITALTQIAATSGTSIQYTSIPEWVRRITFALQGVSISASTNIQIQIGTSGGFVTSGYLGAVGGANFTTGFGVVASAVSGTVTHGTVTLINLGGNIWVSSTCVGFSSSTSSATGGGSVTLGGLLDRVRLTTVSGTATFDAGNVNVMLEG